LIPDELVDYVIDGILDDQLRNQARMQNFETSGKLLEAFKKITLRPERGNPGSTRKDNHNEVRTSQNVAMKKGESDRDRVKIQGRRCFNCQEVGHVSKECQKEKKTVRECYLCKKTGHLVRDCPQRKNGDQESKISDNDHRKTINYVIKKDQMSIFILRYTTGHGKPSKLHQSVGCT